MHRLKAAATAIAGAALITAAATGTAFAWPAGSITLSAACKGEVGKIVLTVGDNYKRGADFTLTNSKNSRTISGHVNAEGITHKTVPYSGAGVVWRATVVTTKKEKITASVTLGTEKACLPPSPTPTPTHSVPAPTPSPTHSVPAPTPSPTHSAPAPVPPPTHSTPPAPGPRLASTGPGDLTLPLTGSLLLVGGGIGAAYYARRAHRRV
ncbi:hypothetical protein ACWD7F_36735 [Streptomyces sp. NPDC005122]